jgi:Effector Associated Constant Component 1
MRERPPAPGRLGPVLDVLRIVADPAAAVLSATLVAWLRTRLGNLRLVLTDERGEEFVVEATHVRGLDTGGVIELTEGLRRFSTGDADADARKATGDVSSRDDGGPVSGAAERPDV